MNILQKLSELIIKGGAGSGCNPQVGDCGRKPSGIKSEPNPQAITTAKAYAKKIGVDYNENTELVQVDVENAKHIAQAYEKMDNDPDNPEVREAYKQLGQEVEAQYKALPVKVEFTKDDPYKSSNEMMNDVKENNRLKVFTGGESHPLLGQKDVHGISLNDKFRAIHDYFGHASRGIGFGANGEENAWIEHSKLFSPLAQRAMTTETRGQNSWFNFSSTNINKPISERSFAEQKVGILPDEFLPPSARRSSNPTDTTKVLKIYLKPTIAINPHLKIDEN